MLKKASVFMLLTLLALSCGQERGSGTGNDTGVAGDEATRPGISGEAAGINNELLSEVIYNFASIVEIPALINDLGVPYHGKFLVPAGEIHQPGTDIGNAVLMGVLGPGMGYLTMYGETNPVPGYVSALKDAASSLEVNQFFDFENIQHLALSQSGASMFALSFMQGYNRTDEHLRKSQLAHLSTAIVVGVWIEGLSLLTHAAENQPDDDLHERIGEQKLILNEMLIVLQAHQASHPGFAPLIEMLKSMKEEYDKVEIVYEVEEPKAVERDGMLMIVQNQRSHVNIDQQQIRNITEKVQTIRNNIIL